MKTMFRSILTRTVFMFSVLLVFALIVVYIIMRIILFNIREIEIQDVKKQMQQCDVAIKFELMDLQKTATDWAEWDDAYQFVHDGNSEFIEGNLGPSFFINLRLDSMMYLNQTGAIMYAQQVSEDGSAVEPTPDAINELFIKLIGKNHHTNKRIQGIAHIPGAALMFATNPVLTSDGAGPVGGNLVIFRYFSQKEIDYLSQMLSRDIHVEQIATDDTYLQSSEGTDDSQISVKVSSDSIIMGTITLNDYMERPALRITTTMNRDMSAIGRSATLWVIVALFLAIISAIVIFLFALHRTLLSRVLSMSNTIKAIGESGDFHRQLMPDGYRDELTAMSDEINGMLQKLQKSRGEIECHEKDLEILTGVLQSEVAERKKAQEEITYLAYHDHLTDMPNRLFFTEHLNRGIQRAGQSKKMLAILFLDLDGFKMINDSMGHQTGDKLIIAVSNRLKTLLRDSDSVARLGGDEFVIMVENLNTVSAIKSMGNRIINAFQLPFSIDNQECFISTSIGIAVYPSDGEDSDTLIKNADIAMYQAKEKGKNQYVVCNESIKDKVSETMKISNQLYHALERNEFELYYQPQISCSNNLIVGVEALIRWHNPEMGLVLPGKFIPVAEQTGLILAIGEWVLRTACTQAKRWQDAKYPPLRMGVNLSIRQFQNHNIVSEVRSVLTDTGLDPSSLELEITESIAMQEKEYIMEALQTLRNMGIHISIDDFGTEYSSMNHLKQLPVDRIKIPMPFIHGINISQKDEAITKSIIVLAKSLGLGVIAEGVETQGQYEFLTQRMCDEVQGYYYYKPMPAADLDELLVSQHSRFCKTV